MSDESLSTENIEMMLEKSDLWLVRAMVAVDDRHARVLRGEIRKGRNFENGWSDYDYKFAQHVLNSMCDHNYDFSCAYRAPFRPILQPECIGVFPVIVNNRERITKMMKRYSHQLLTISVENSKNV